MNITKIRAKRLSWLLAPSLLFMALVAGAFGLASTHAASPLDGVYNFRAATTSGPASGTYITGTMSLTVGGNNTISGTMCGLSIAHSKCVTITGSVSNNVNITFHVNGQPSIVSTGSYVAHPGGHASAGFFGTFTYGASSGSWSARSNSVVTYDGSWNFRADILSGTHKGTQFHGVLTLAQGANDGVSGTYCVAANNCTIVLSGLNRNGMLVFYINMGGAIFRLEGTFDGSHDGRISGQFRPATDNSATADKGYWVGHPVAKA